MNTENTTSMGLGLSALSYGLIRGLGRVSNGQFNSKLELKTWILQHCQYANIDFDETMAKFKEEYDALPLTPNESLSKEFQKSLDSLKDMADSLIDKIVKVKSNLKKE